MKQRAIRLRLVLPVVFGFFASMLMMWDYENNRMVELMGMGWDTGPPVWPYQVVYILLSGVNAPIFVMSFPVLDLLKFQTLSLQYAVWLPAIVGWWWWVGTRIDFGLLGRRKIRHTKSIACVLAAGAVVFLCFGASESVAEFRWLKEYGREWSPIVLAALLRTIGSVSWCLALVCGCSIAAVRLFRNQGSATLERRARYVQIAIAAVLSALYLFVLHCWDGYLNPPFNYDECEVDRLYGFGCVHGTVVDERGKPITHIEVDLIPMNRSGNARWYSTRSEWTDEQGRYNLNRIEPGGYLVGVNAFTKSSGPTAERPFTTAYYPAAERESEAAAVSVLRSSPLRLSPIKLRTLELATVKINILWFDGTRPDRSNVYFSNVLYPNGGGTAPQIDYGVGKYTLPKGFEYDATASVECDLGNIHESRESRPEQRIKVADGSTPTEMTFVIPGPRCKLYYY